MEATLAYKTEAADLQRQLRHLQYQFDMLSSQASTFTQGRRVCVGVTSVVNGHLTTINDSLSERNLQGPYRLVAEEGKSKCCCVNLDDVSSNYVRDSEEVNDKQQAILLTLKSQVSSDEAHIHLDQHSLRTQLERHGQHENFSS